MRTASFLVLPLLYVLIVVGSELFRGRFAIPWLLSVGAATALTVSIVVPHVREFNFTPVEAWMEVARYIEANFPHGTAVCTPFRNHFLISYLDDAYPIVEDLDEASFLAGKQIVVDSNFHARKRFNPRTYTEKGDWVEIPQRRGGRQVVAFVPQ